MLPSDIKFKANPAERWFRSFVEPSRYAAFFGVALAYALVFALLVFENRLRPAVAPETVAIPVEIVVESPAPEKPPAAEKPDPTPAPPVSEDPAFDAPRAANNEKIETETHDETLKVAPAPPPPSPTSPSPDQSKKDSADPILDKAGGETPASSEPDREKPDQQQAKADTEADKPKTQIDNRFPTFESVPDVDFGSAAKQTPVSGGKAKATYLSIVYGMIMPHMRSPVGARPKSGKLEGTVVFSVDGTGIVTDRRVIRQSGSRELDAAALEAIAQAAPFPPPPRGAPIGLRFTYGAE